MLSKLQKLREEREQGFTLIELLVVILIIGILAAIAIPAFLNQRKSAVDSSVQSDVTNAAKAIETAAVKAGAGSIDFTNADYAKSNANNTITVTPTVGTYKPAIVTQVSEGTEMTFTGNTRDGYTITGKNVAGDISNGVGFVYSSSAGGLK